MFYLIKVKIFDYEHEKDLEQAMNAFLQKLDESQLVNINYHVAALVDPIEETQVYCFSAMIIYKK